MQDDYTTGTISLTSGLANFTTSGAALEAAGIGPGDQILLPAKGLLLTIATITGQNAGTLTDPCPAAAAGSGQAYRIRFQNDASRLSARHAALIALLSGGNAEALSGLTGANGRLPIFTGPGAMGTIATISAIRDFLGAETLSGARAAINAERIPDVVGTFTGNWNELTNGGWHTQLIGTNNTNHPVSGEFFYCLVIRAGGDGNNILQVAFPYSDGGFWYRKRNGGTWGIWRRIFTPENILGAVTQSGGTPTGALMERGSNANGTFERYACGTQICQIVPFAVPSISTAMSVSGLFRSASLAWAYPASFSNNPVVTGKATSGNIGWPWMVSNFNNDTSTALAQVAFIATASQGSPTNWKLMAIGRWF